MTIYDEMSELKKDVLSQRGKFCWAIALATVVGYLYYSQNMVAGLEWEVSHQDIIDRVWYYNDEERKKGQDQRGFYESSFRKGYKFVRDKGVALLRNYPFEGRLDENKGPIKDIEYPRIFISDFDKLTVDGVVSALKNKKTVTACILVTPAFEKYKQGIYETPDDADPRILPKHAVVIVGMNEEEGYFIIRNSWGPEWGEDGYGKVKFNSFREFICPISAWKEDYPRT